MLYNAIFVPEGIPPLPKSIIDAPEISKYVEDWGKETDFGIIVEVDHKPIGAIWGRLLDEDHKGYGYIDSKTPELSMAVEESYRGKGIGDKLLSIFLVRAKELGYKSISLSVDKRNKAFEFYKRMGFKIVSEQETAYTMSWMRL